MDATFRHLVVAREPDGFRVRLRLRQIDEPAIHELAQELIRLGSEEGCRRVVLSLGPDAPECLYSVFLAKLVTVQRCLRERGARLALADVSPVVYSIFEACKLQDHFEFIRDAEGGA
jgi:hypothetical protein